MTQEEKQKLLLKELCARLPWGVKTSNGHGTLKLSPRTDVIYVVNNGHIPYLRPMSSMTDEEKNEWMEITHAQEWLIIGNLDKAIDWLNSHHFDYRGLIPMGLALEAPKDMYKN